MTIQVYKRLAAILMAVILIFGASALVAQEGDAPAAEATTEKEKSATENEGEKGEGEKAEGAEEAAVVQPAEGSLPEMWNSLLYYIRIARPELARSYAMGILNSNPKPEELYQLTIKTPNWQSTLVRGAKLTGLLKDVDSVRKLIESGYDVQRADPTEIANSIDMLATGVRAYELGASRLQASGEYAMPQLVQRLMDPKTTEVLRERIINVMPRMGVAAVRPLGMSLLSDNGEVQLAAANALGQIGYPQAAPRLKQLLEAKDTLPDVKKAAERALVSIAGQAALSKTSAELFYDLAEKYYYKAESLTPDERYDTANVWFWLPGQGLSFRPVPRQVFNDIYAMRNAALALRADPNHYPAISLWLAANIRREANLPKDVKDPTVAATDMSAEFYALASSAKFLQDVLERGLKDQESAVAIGAINALGKTAGAKNLLASLPGGAQPLVHALNYPDRQVRFLAATTLAAALPTEPFNGADLVAPVLNEALRQTGTRNALLIVEDEETRNTMKAAIRAQGFEVIDQADPIKAMAAARASTGIDVVVLAEKPAAAEVIGRLRADAVLSGAPVAVLDGSQSFARFAKNDKRIVIMEKLDAAVVKTALTSAIQAGAGQPLSAEQASAWAIKAAQAVRVLGLTNNQIVTVAQTQEAMIGALADKRGEVQTAAAAGLAMMSDKKAQQAVANLALDGKADEKVRVAAFASLSESIRKFGNMISDQQAQGVLEVVNNTGASRDIRNAAAGSLGALNLPSEKIKDLIPIPSNI